MTATRVHSAKSIFSCSGRLSQDRAAHRRVAQPCEFHDGHHAVALSVQPNDLLAPFVKLLKLLVTSVFLVRIRSTRMGSKRSIFMVPDQ
jgi:hypothetical protein